jgi:hypothetical protein
MRPPVRACLLTAALLCAPLSALQAQVSLGVNLPGLSIGISVPVYPQLQRVPGYPVYYAPGLRSNYFFYDGLYWIYQGDDWYRSEWYDGPWERIDPQDVPLYVLRVPVRYYRNPPSYFMGWVPSAAPRWGEHWGSAWEQRRSGWDHWNRAAAPPPAPLPNYQRPYTGNRYPGPAEQRELRDSNVGRQSRSPQARPPEPRPSEQPGGPGRPPPRAEAPPPAAARPGQPAEAQPQRPPREGRPPDQGAQGTRPAPADARPQAPRGERPARPDAPPRAERPAQPDAPQRAERPAQPPAPPRADRPAQPPAPPRAERPARADAPPRTDAPARAERPQRPPEPQPAPQQGNGGDHPNRQPQGQAQDPGDDRRQR